MVIVIFCGGDKEGETQREEIEYGCYAGQDHDMVNILCVTVIIQNRRDVCWREQKNIKYI